MHTPQTIVIIGSGDKGKGIAYALSAGTDKVLLCDHDYDTTKEYAEQLQANHPYYDIEAANCAYNATWEADIIILDLSCNALLEAAGKIKIVANQKVIVTSNNSVQALQELLPNSKIIQAFNNIDAKAFYLAADERKVIDCFVAGEHKEALDTVTSLIKAIGFNPVLSTTAKVAGEQAA